MISLKLCLLVILYANTNPWPDRIPCSSKLRYASRAQISRTSRSESSPSIRHCLQQLPGGREDQYIVGPVPRQERVKRGKATDHPQGSYPSTKTFCSSWIAKHRFPTPPPPRTTRQYFLGSCLTKPHHQQSSLPPSICRIRAHFGAGRFPQPSL
jgi:hypothetical protein